MRKTVEKEVEFCDICGKEMPYPCKCLICGKDICYGCHEDNMTEFTHSAHCSGSSDGQYCNECLSKPIPTEHQPLLNAYRAIEMLTKEAQLWSEDYETRRKAAEKRVQELIK